MPGKRAELSEGSNPQTPAPAGAAHSVFARNKWPCDYNCFSSVHNEDAERWSFHLNSKLAGRRIGHALPSQYLPKSVCPWGPLMGKEGEHVPFLAPSICKQKAGLGGCVEVGLVPVGSGQSP